MTTTLSSNTDEEFILLSALKALYNAPPYHYVIESLLILWIVKLIFYSSDKKKNDKKRLTEAQEQELIDEWQPEPLVPEVSDDPLIKPVNSRLVTGIPSTRIIVNNKECINLATFNFLNFIGNKSHHDRAIAAIRKYGVGSCGPRGFYGTVDVHLNLEEQLAKFLNVEEAILYSYGFATAASAIPAYSKRGDVIFADEQCNFSIQKGIDTSRSKVYYYEHNNMVDLERLLKEQDERDRRNKKKAAKTRKFIVTEGIFINTGELCPLDEIIEFKYKYKVRVFLDESISFGTIGATGRGLTEYLNIDRQKVDMIMCNLEYSIGSNGGFCAGSSYVIDHQRLSGLGYCFSASLPPLLTVASSESLDLIEKHPEKLIQLQEKSKLIQSCLLNGHREKGGKYPLAEMFTPYPNVDSPIMHIYCELDQDDRTEARKALDRLVEYCDQDGVAIVQSAYLWNAEVLQSRRPSIRITTSIGLTNEEIVYACNIIKRNSVIVAREYENGNFSIDAEPMEPVRPNSLPIIRDIPTNSNSSSQIDRELLSSPVLENPGNFMIHGTPRRVRTHSGSQGADRVIQVRRLSSDEETDSEPSLENENKKDI